MSAIECLRLWSAGQHWVEESRYILLADIDLRLSTGKSLPISIACSSQRQSKTYQHPVSHLSRAWWWVRRERAWWRRILDWVITGRHSPGKNTGCLNRARGNGPRKRDWDSGRSHYRFTRSIEITVECLETRGKVCGEGNIRSECRGVLTKRAVKKFQIQEAEKKIFTNLMKKEREDGNWNILPR